MKVLIDTCVIIDALQSRKPYCAEAEQIFIEGANKTFDGYISANTATDIYYLMHRATHSIEQSRNLLNNLFTLFDIINTTKADCINALSSEISDYEDAVMHEAALNSNCNYIVTRNVSDFKHSAVPILTPSEFLNLLNT